ncbi:hypothetical protein D910_02251 [Dendroctonus ponderosae]|uniref:Nicotinic acetylcholine receptor alpha 1 subunit n=1 Tax=Dendroctonus ponderosae TaxID=77166 RepID=U4TVN3_DENPD|nr:hypothetical protein D910_02251 [Dendroctonus ponderosae]
MECLLAALLILTTGPVGLLDANPEAKRLYDDLLSNYNRLIRPVGNNSDRLTVKMGLKLSQLIDVEWNDYKLKWNPDDYGGVETLHVPSEHIWLPDIVLYNNADGNYEVTIMTKAILHHTGKVIWKPPAIYKSFCEIDVEYFPFDEQTCFMKFGSWTYDGYLIDLRHLKQGENSNNIAVGIDLQDYYISVEWDIMKVPAVRNEKYYSCCEEPYPDIIFNLTLRRKTLFYTVNLIIPCVGISFLSILVFYLPSDSGEKVSLSISILLSLTVFFLLLVETIPPTSITVPLLGKYLLFTMLLCTLSVVVTIAVLNVNFRSPVTHKLAPWVRTVFIETLPPILFIKRPKKDDDDNEECMLTDVLHIPGPFNMYEKPTFESFDLGLSGGRFEIPPPGLACFDEPPFPLPLAGGDDELYSPASCRTGAFDPPSDVSPGFGRVDGYDMEKTIADSKFIAQHVRNKDSFENVEEDWKYVAMVLDRLFLWIFTLACVVGTGVIILNAPSLYDTTKPIDVVISKVAKKRMALLQMVPEEV